MSVGRSIFLVTFSDAPDAIVRILDLFVVQGASIEALELRRDGASAALRVEVRNLEERRGDFLQQKLRMQRAVRSVAHGRLQCAGMTQPTIDHRALQSNSE